MTTHFQARTPIVRSHQRGRLLTMITVAAWLATAAVAQEAAALDAPPEAVPMEINCASDFAVQPFVDGNHTDWDAGLPEAERVQQLVAGQFRYDWTGPRDASFKIWCRETSSAMFFAIVGRDNEFHGRTAGSRGDRFQLYFQLPGDRGRTRDIVVEADISGAVEYEPTQLVYVRGGTPGAEVPASRAAVSPRNNAQGFFLELEIPRSALSDGGGVTPINFAAVQRDIDGDQVREQEVAISTAPFRGSSPSEYGRLTRGALDRMLDNVRESTGLPANTAPTHAHYVNLGGDAAEEYVALLDDQLVMLGAPWAGFNGAAFPTNVGEGQRPLSFEFSDLDDDGDQEVIYTFAYERTLADGTGITEEIAAVFDLSSGGITLVGMQQQALTMEGSGELRARRSLVRRPGYRIVLFARARGDLSAEDYRRAMDGMETEYSWFVTRWHEGEEHVYYFPMGDSWVMRRE